MSTGFASRRRPSAVMSVGLLALTAILAAALVAAFRPRPGSGPAATAATAGKEELARLRDEMKQMRRQMQVMAQQGNVGGGVTGRSDTLTSAASTPAEAPLSPQEVELRDRRHFEAIERKLASEPVDASWAPATERLINETMARPIFAGSKLLASTCHSTLCRFEVGHSSEGDRRRFGSLLPNRLPSLPSGSMRRADGSDPRTIVYVAREGHQIPREEAREEAQ